MTLEKAKKEIARQFTLASHGSVEYLLSNGLRIARERSSGGLTYSRMTELDHPYAARHPQILVSDKNRINVHEGAFKRGWFKDRLSTSFDVGGAIVNDTEVADWLQEGTRLMHPRDVQGDIEDRLASLLPNAEKLLADRLERGTT